MTNSSTNIKKNEQLPLFLISWTQKKYHDISRWKSRSWLETGTKMLWGLNQLNLQWSQCSFESTHQIVIDEKYSIRHQIENLQQFKSEITCKAQVHGDRTPLFEYFFLIWSIFPQIAVNNINLLSASVFYPHLVTININSYW